MKNSIGREFNPQRKDVTFTPLHGKKLRCNKCEEKVTRNWVNGHEKWHLQKNQMNSYGNLHLPKKVEDQVGNINKQINDTLEEIIHIENNASLDDNLEKLLRDLGVKKRVNNIFKRVASLPKDDKSRLSSIDLQHLEQYR